MKTWKNSLALALLLLAAFPLHAQSLADYCTDISPADIGACSDLSFVDSLNGFVTGATLSNGQSGVFRTTDGGSTWDFTSMPNTTMGFRSVIDFTADGIAVAVDEHGLVMKTTDAGNTWSTSTPVNFDSTLFPMDIEWAGSLTGYFAAGPVYSTGPMELYKTSDGGLNWNLVPAPALTNFHFWPDHLLLFSDSLHGYVCGDSGKLFYTDDGAQTWSAFATGTPGSLTGVYRFANGHLAVSGLGGGSVSIDNGQNWTPLSMLSGYSAVLDESLMFQTVNYTVGNTVCTASLFRNLGSQWELLTQSANSLIYKGAMFSPTAGFLLVGGCWSMTGIGGSPSRVYKPGSLILAKEEPFHADEVVVYPQPASGAFHLNWSEISFTSGIAEITDHQGRCLWRQAVQGSDGEVLIDLGEAAAGLYVWRLHTEAGSASGKVIVTR